MRSFKHKHSGFTLPELLIAMGIMAILTAIAVPSYSSYVTRSRLTEAFDMLSAHRIRMEQFYSDSGNYGTAGCAVQTTSSRYFTASCTLANGGQSFTSTATGIDAMAGFTFTVDDAGNRRTTAFKEASALPANCWLTSKGGC